MVDAENAGNAAPKKEYRKKFDRAKKDEYLEMLRNGIRRGKASHQVGVNPATVQRHMDRYPNFAAEVSQAEMLADNEVEEALYTAAISGNVVACQVWLYNRRPEAWADRRNLRAEVSGPGGEPIKQDVTVAVDALSNSNLRTTLEAVSHSVEGQPSGYGG